MRCSFVVLLACLTQLIGASICSGQPAVTDGLSVYYSFDDIDEDGLFTDGSPNALHGLVTLGFEDANEDDLDDIRLDTENKVRGAGSVLFDTNAEIKEDYIAICDPIISPDHNDGCGEFLDDRADYVPSDGFTVAAWVKVEDVGSDHSVYQSRAGGGGFIHVQVQGDGNVRFRLRGDANGDNIVQFNEPPDGQPIAFEEWFHYAGTWQKDDDPDTPGEWAFYLDGEEVAGGEANGNAAGLDPLNILGDWGQGAFIGLTPDFNRQYVGNMDEFYLFNRALSAEEIALVRDGVTPGPIGDFNGSGERDPGDLDLLADAMMTNDAAFDLDGDGDADADDRLFWIKDLTNTFVGDSNFDGEFSSADFVTVFVPAKYETGQAATWAEGDWNGDKVFDSADFVAAFTDGGYESGQRDGGLVVVPEPSAMLLLVLGMIGFLPRRK